MVYRFRGDEGNRPFFHLLCPIGISECSADLLQFKALCPVSPGPVADSACRSLPLCPVSSGLPSPACLRVWERALKDAGT